MSAERLGKKSGKLVEAAAPALRVAIARGLIEELLVDQRQHRSRPVGLDEDRDQRLALGRGAPRPGENEFLLRNHLAIDAAHVMLFAVLGREGNGVAASHLDVRGGVLNRPGIRAEPFQDFFGVGPGGVDFLRRGIETTFEGEDGLFGEWGLGGHESSSTKAASRSSWSDQKGW